MSLLKKTRNKADSFNWVEEPSIEEDLPRQVDRNSTMKESFSGNESSIMTSMALASLNISECKPRDGKEIDKQTFERWKQTLQAALQISGIEDERAKANAFTIKAGEKLKDLLEATSSGVDAPDETLFPYSNMMYRLEQHFGSQDYLLLQRQKLRSLLQETGEEDSKYVRRVVAGAKLCGYSDDSLFENVVDVLQAHALSLDVRKACRKLLRSKEAPKRKLEHLLEEVDALEVDQKHEAIFARNHPPLRYPPSDQVIRCSAVTITIRREVASQRGRHTHRDLVTATKARRTHRDPVTATTADITISGAITARGLEEGGNSTVEENHFSQTMNARSGAGDVPVHTIPRIYVTIETRSVTNVTRRVTSLERATRYPRNIDPSDSSLRKGSFLSHPSCGRSLPLLTITT